jgi:hypothetical protein
MDLFDGEPYLGLMPRRLARKLGIVALVTIAVYSPARLWLINQAEHHVAHEIQPMIDRLTAQTSPASPVDPRPGSTRSNHHPMP